MADFNDLGYVGLGGERRFDDPFLLPSSASMPLTLETAIDMCLFLYYMNPQYVQASARVARHFITDFDFPGDGSKQEKEDFKTYLKYQLQLPSFMTEMGDEWSCFSGDTKVNTRDGVFEIKDLADKRVEVLSKGGVYRPADFKCYGKQPLMEVTFSDGRKVYATAAHQWEVINRSNKQVVTTTDKLIPGYKIERTVAPRPDRNDEYYEGIRHGFIFGDGSLSSRNKRSTALFVGAKDAALFPFFKGYGNTPRPRRDKKDMVRISGFPAAYKSLPSRTASPSYWYGFVCGFLAADGCVCPYGCAMLTQISRATIEAVVEQLPRIGMCAGPIRSQRRITDLSKYSKYPNAVYDSTIHFVTLLKRFMLPQDFLIPAHREKFIKKFKGGNYGRYVIIRSVKKTDRVEPVYCCTEMQTHRFVVDNGILTGNCFGNCFVRIHMPFDRFLIDDRTNTMYALDYFGRNSKYNYQTMTYEVPDPLHPGKRVRLRFRDQRSRDASRIRLRKLYPRLVTIRHNIISGGSEYIYRFDPEFVSDVKKGRLYVVNETPMKMLQAIKNNHDFAFDADSIFHLKSPTVSGVSNAGWGIPNTIANYRNLHQLQVYRKIDEAVGLDYMLPFRLFSPAEHSGQNDAFNYMISSRWGSEIKKIIDSRRRDKYAMHSLPFPVTYQEFGAQGKTLTSKDMMEFQTSALLDGMGYPQELFKGSLTWMQVPTAMRLFENSFMFLHMGFNNVTGWVTRRVRTYLNQPQMAVTMQKPSLADSLERKQLVFQLGAMGEISRENAYNSLGIDDPVGEMKKRLEEDMEIQREQIRMQSEFQKEVESGSLLAPEQASGGSASGSLPGGGAAGSVTPTDSQSQAQSLASYWLSIQSPGERRQAMNAVRAQNQGLYASAKEQMERMRSQGSSQGRQAVEQQAQQQGATQ
jgi:hypothetical protein